MGGIDLAGKARFAFCVNGYYRVRKRTGRHYPERVYTNPKTGEQILRFHSFACTLNVGSRTFKLYLVALPANSWRVRADR